MFSKKMELKYFRLSSLNEVINESGKKRLETIA